jgi:hypothetical protein
MLPAPAIDPFRSLTFDQYDALTEHLADTRHALILIGEVLSAQTSGRGDDSAAEISVRILEALVDRADAAEQHLAAIDALLETAVA